MTGLKIPANARCLVPRCQRKVTHVFSTRMRRLDTGADWAPNSAAYFCTKHADDGARISVFYEPTKTKIVEVIVGVVPKLVQRSTKIKRRMGERV